MASTAMTAKPLLDTTTAQEHREALDRAKKPRSNAWRVYQVPKAPRPDKDRVIPFNARMGIRP